MRSTEQMIEGYLEAMAFFDCGPDHETNDADFSDELKTKARTDCAKFIEAISAIKGDLVDLTLAECLDEYASEYSDKRMGVDFWLTRNHHGAGFWDRDELNSVVHGSTITLGDCLSTVAQRFGNVDLYLGDDGKVYGS